MNFRSLNGIFAKPRKVQDIGNLQFICIYSILFYLFRFWLMPNIGFVKSNLCYLHSPR